MVNVNQGVPQGQIADKDGNLLPVWYQFFLTIWRRTGGASGTLTAQLDTISDIQGSTLYRGLTQWMGLSPGAQFKVLRMGTAYPEWDVLDGQSFGAQGSGQFFIGPAAGAANIPTFRKVVSSDLAPIAGQFPGTTVNDTAGAGNVGEYISSEIGAGAAVAMPSGVSTDVTSIALSPGDWDVWGNVATVPDASTTQSNISAWVSPNAATDPGPPNGGGYVQLQMPIAVGQRQVVGIPIRRFSLSTATAGRVALSANVSFSGSLSAYGFIGARRAR